MAHACLPPPHHPTTPPTSTPRPLPRPGDSLCHAGPWLFPAWLPTMQGSLEALELLEKVTYNAAVQPNEEKFRKLKLGNKKIQAS